MRALALALVLAVPASPFAVTAPNGAVRQYYRVTRVEGRLVRLDVVPKAGASLNPAELARAREELRRTLERGLRRRVSDSVNVRVRRAGPNTALEATFLASGRKLVQDVRSDGTARVEDPARGAEVTAFGAFDLLIAAPLPYGPLPASGGTFSRDRARPLAEVLAQYAPSFRPGADALGDVTTRFAATFRGPDNDGRLVFDFASTGDPAGAAGTFGSGATGRVDVQGYRQTGTVRYGADGLPRTGTTTATARTRTVQDLGDVTVTAETDVTVTVTLGTRTP